MDRVTHPKTSPSERIKWSRIVIAAGQASNSVLRDVEIEALRKQVEELKEFTEEKLSEWEGEDQEGPAEAASND